MKIRLSRGLEAYLDTLWANQKRLCKEINEIKLILAKPNEAELEILKLEERWEEFQLNNL